MSFVAKAFPLPLPSRTAPAVTARQLSGLGCPAAACGQSVRRRRSCGGCRRSLGSLGINWGSLVTGIATAAGSAEELVQAFKKPPSFTPTTTQQTQPQAQLTPANYVQASQQPQLVYSTQASSSLIPGVSNTTLAIGAAVGVVGIILIGRRR